MLVKYEGQVGDLGSYEAGLGKDGVAVAKLEVKFDIVAELEKLALRTDNKIDDGMVQMIKSALGR